MVATNFLNDAAKAGRSAWRPAVAWPLVAGLVSVPILALALVIGKLYGTNSSELMRDPATVFSIPVYAGAISYLGVLVLGAAGVVKVFSAVVVAQKSALLLWAGILTLVLALDDLFLVHEHIAPSIGIASEIVFLAYAGMLLGVILALAWTYPLADYVGIFVAIAFLGMSVVLDTISDNVTHVPYWMENAPKLAGYIAWLIFWGMFCARELRVSLARPRAA